MNFGGFFFRGLNKNLYFCSLHMAERAFFKKNKN